MSIHQDQARQRIQQLIIRYNSLSAEEKKELTEASDVDTDYLNFINEWRLKLAQDIVQRPRQNPWTISPDGSLRLCELSRKNGRAGTTGGWLVSC